MSDGARLVAGYHRLEVVYRGETSTIYRGLPDGGSDPVAIKVLRDPAGVDEVDQLTTLSGAPGIVAALDNGQTSSGRTYVVMPFYDGDYAARLAHHPIPLTEVVLAAWSVANALTAMHERGLLHHGVQPSNVLYSRDTTVLADFGSTAPVTDTPEPPGPDAYEVPHAPPEALRGDPPSPASDVYRLASTVWTLLGGHLPYVDAAGTRVDPFDYRDRALATPPPRIPRADVPQTLRDVVQRAMSVEPSDRFATATDFATALITAHPAASAFLAPIPRAPEAGPAGAVADPRHTTPIAPGGTSPDGEANGGDEGRADSPSSARGDTERLGAATGDDVGAADPPEVAQAEGGGVPGSAVSSGGGSLPASPARDDVGDSAESAAPASDLTDTDDVGAGEGTASPPRASATPLSDDARGARDTMEATTDRPDAGPATTRSTPPSSPGDDEHTGDSPPDVSSVAEGTAASGPSTGGATERRDPDTTDGVGADGVVSPDTSATSSPNSADAPATTTPPAGDSPDAIPPTPSHEDAQDAGAAPTHSTEADADSDRAGEGTSNPGHASMDPLPDDIRDTKDRAEATSHRPGAGPATESTPPSSPGDDVHTGEPAADTSATSSPTNADAPATSTPADADDSPDAAPTAPSRNGSTEEDAGDVGARAGDAVQTTAVPPDASAIEKGAVSPVPSARGAAERRGPGTTDGADTGEAVSPDAADASASSTPDDADDSSVAKPLTPAREGTQDARPNEADADPHGDKETSSPSPSSADEEGTGGSTPDTTPEHAAAQEAEGPSTGQRETSTVPADASANSSPNDVHGPDTTTPPDGGTAPTHATPADVGDSSDATPLTPTRGDAQDTRSSEAAAGDVGADAGARLDTTSPPPDASAEEGITVPRSSPREEAERQGADTMDGVSTPSSPEGAQTGKGNTPQPPPPADSGGAVSPDAADASAGSSPDDVGGPATPTPTDVEGSSDTEESASTSSDADSHRDTSGEDTGESSPDVSSGLAADGRNDGPAVSRPGAHTARASSGAPGDAGAVTGAGATSTGPSSNGGDESSTTSSGDGSASAGSTPGDVSDGKNASGSASERPGSGSRRAAIRRRGTRRTARARTASSPEGERDDDGNSPSASHSPSNASTASGDSTSADPEADGDPVKGRSKGASTSAHGSSSADTEEEDNAQRSDSDSGDADGRTPPSKEAITALVEQLRQATDNARTGAGGSSRPEDAWAALPGWSGSSAAPPPAPAGPPQQAQPGPPESAPTVPAEPSAPPRMEAGPPVGHQPGPSAPAPAPPPPPDYSGIAAPARQRPALIAVAVIAIGFLAVTAAAIAFLRPGLGGDLIASIRGSDGAGGDTQAEDDMSTPLEQAPDAPPAPPAEGNPEAAPTDVEIVEDLGHEVVLSWTDNTDGSGSHHVVGGQSGAVPGNLVDADPGETEVRVSGLNTGVDYCFTVISVLSVDDVGSAEQVCTTRETDGEQA
ncbi:protein kinase [Spiractinospora alimapuensis]|uniref:protein kinase domain-containing protein n=1 Tax=Spiractinospora alimapuensis TaxID=2820884 RepID=UPI001F481EE1|nr:protein kinase [Spiractinospora alimapuensis]QVQ53881.1 protein kinase [Spiractinospora alimapuensis]